MADSTNTVDLDAIQDYSRVHGQRIMMELLQEEEDREFLTPIDFKDEYVHHTSSVTEIVQSYQPGHHPKGEVGLKPRVQRHSGWKADLLLTPREYSGRHFLAQFAKPGSNPYDMPLLNEWVVKNIYRRAIHDQNRSILWKGVNQGGAIIGYPNAAQDVSDGFNELVSQDIIKGDIDPFNTGVLTKVNILDKITRYLEMIHEDPKWEGVPLVTNMSSVLLRWLRQAYREEHGGNTHATEFNFFTLEDFPNVTFKARPGMRTSQRLITSRIGNLHRGFDGELESRNGQPAGGPMSLVMEYQDRYLKVLCDGEISVQYALASEVFVNDQY